MEVKITEKYCACDGKEFWDEEECLNHEMKILGIEAYDENLNELGYGALTRTEYIYCPSIEAIRWFAELYDFCREAYESMSTPGLYVYDYDYEQFKLVSEILNELHEKEVPLLKAQQMILGAHK